MSELDPTLIVGLPILISGFAMAALGLWIAYRPGGRERRDP